jgi:hypothetical protein
MISSAVKTKSIEVKDKVKDYIVHTSLTESTHPTPRLIIQFNLFIVFNPLFLINRHVSKQDKVDNLYRQKNQVSVFSLDDTEEEQNTPELVDIESWFLRSDMLYKYECEHIDENNRTHPR